MPNNIGYLEAATIRANMQLCLVWLQNVIRGWPMQTVARLEICTMRIKTVLHSCTLLASNIIVKSCH